MDEKLFAEYIVARISPHLLTPELRNGIKQLIWDIASHVEGHDIDNQEKWVMLSLMLGGFLRPLLPDFDNVMRMYSNSGIPHIMKTISTWYEEIWLQKPMLCSVTAPIAICYEALADFVRADVAKSASPLAVFLFFGRSDIFDYIERKYPDSLPAVKILSGALEQMEQMGLYPFAERGIW